MYRLVIFFLILLTGCGSIGPKNIDVNRSRYNDVVAETDLEQVLKNIVRLRYAQPSSYFQVSSVIASSSLVSNLSGQWANSSFYGSAWFLNPTVVYSDSPTVSFTPVQGKEFVNSLAKPIPFNYFLLLSHNGTYNFDLLSKTLLSQVGSLVNSPSATNISVDTIPEYEEFYHFIDVVNTMIDNNGIIPSSILFNKSPGLMLTFTQKDSSDALWVKKMMNIPAQSENMIFMQQAIALPLEENAGFLKLTKSKQYKNVVHVRTRSVDGIVAFLSHGVQIPPSLLSSHVTVEKYTNDGSVYNWGPLMKNIITIYSSTYSPNEDVFVKTCVNHRWYYIKASDLDSKATLFLLIKLMQMVAVLPQNQPMPGITLG